jgi:apolipoprotein N-acyltransferase
MAYRLGLACVSAALLTLSVLPLGFGWLAWIALVPLILAVHGTTASDPGQSAWGAAVLGAVFGAFSAAGTHFYVWRLSAFQWADALILAAYLALYPAGWAALLAWLRRRRRPAVVAGAAGWAVLHVLRAHVGFLSLPWEPLSHGQTGNVALLQVASVGGAPLVAFVVCAANIAVAEAWQARSNRRLAWAAAGIVAVHGWGLLRIQLPARERVLQVAVIQPGSETTSGAVQLQTLRALTLRASAAHAQIVVWPESAVHGFGFDAGLQEQIVEIARDAQVPILFGSADFGKYAEDAPKSPEEIEFKNQAFFVQPDGTWEGPYTKNRLVPFAESVPLAGRVHWPRWLVARTRHGIAGDGPGLFHLPDGRIAGVLICWENLFGDLSARLARAGASVIVQLTNDSDFKGNAEPAQHNAASVLRAVEYGRPVVVASASGPSLAVDARGGVLRALVPTGSWMIASVNTEDGVTVYSRCGLLWLWVVCIVALAAEVRETLKRERA